MNKETYISKQKTYSELLNDISKEELFKGLLAYGIFEEKIPNFLSSKNFFDFCIQQTNDFFNDTKKEANFIIYESMRNINIPREIAIPNPFAYRHLCYELSENWDSLQEYFREATDYNTHKISRIHIRKIENQEKIFERCYDKIEENDIDESINNNIFNTGVANYLFKMNHKNFCADDYPEPILLIGSSYIVYADISNCFPSIYSHSIPWSLIGKDNAKLKKNRDEDIWYNTLDVRTRNLKDGETQGLLIGPHASNLISEIVLVQIDKSLFKKGYKFIRYIDDYSCYVKSQEEADRFLIDLSSELKKYSLSLNHKKTKIEKLPLLSSKYWIRKLKQFIFIENNGYIGLDKVREFLDIALDLMSQDENNSSVINYAVRLLSKKKMTERAKDYFIKTIHHLVLIYPYLIQLLDKEVFETFKINIDEIEKISKDIYKLGKQKKLYEAMSYSVYFSLKYNFEITDIEISDYLYNDAEESMDTIFMLLCYLYDKKKMNNKLDSTNMKKYKKLANLLKDDEMDNYWLFVYEVLTADALPGHWKSMKRDKVTFLSIPKYKFEVDILIEELLNHMSG